MKLYSNKQKWKIALLFVALLLVGASLYISNRIVSRVAQRERSRVTQWADAIKKRAQLVRLTNSSFDELRKKELSEMQLWIAATKRISRQTPLNSYQSYDLALRIIHRNKNIPVIVLDQDDNVSTYINLNFTQEDLADAYPDKDSISIVKMFDDSLVKLAHHWEKRHPSFTIEIYKDMYMSYFYSDSKKIIALEAERDSLFKAFNKELIRNAELVPVVLTDSLKKTVLASNLPAEKLDSAHLKQTLRQLAGSNPPLKIFFGKNEVRYIFYDTSPILLQLKYFPYIQFVIFGLFVLIGYIIFSTFRKAEQNQVWAGMAKETAHQLGTPISSLMAWIQMLEGKTTTADIAKEMNKDVERLTQVTDRFSKIGATTRLEMCDIVTTTKHCLNYLKTRFPEKVSLNFTTSEDKILIPHNPSLMEWVIENICKNAIDAMSGNGEIKVHINQQHNRVLIDISDNGKGMTASQQRNVFSPGFTTKKRGWGLGLPLAKRIVDENHKGKLKILSSEVGKGTTFRISLPKE